MKNKIIIVTVVLAVMFAMTGVAMAILQTANISGMKFSDLNRNGIKDEGESGLANWTIKLTEPGQEYPINTLTDSNGNYIFSELAAGNYTVGEVLQTGWTQTAPAEETYNVTLAGVDVKGKDFGNFNTSPTLAKSCKITVISSDANGTTLKVDFPAFQTSKVNENGSIFDVLESPGCGKMGEIGKPALPQYGIMLAVPFKAMFSVSVIETNSTIQDEYLVYPVQEPAADILDSKFPPFPTPPFYMDEEFYRTDQIYPATIATIEAAGTLRDVRVLPLRFAAFQHNPVRKELVFYSSMTVRINYIYESGPYILKQVEHSSNFKGLYSTLINYEPIVVSEPISAEATGYDFLIITDPGLVNAANTLSARRNAQGISTLVVTTNNSFNTAEQIKAYIQNSYDTLSPRPSYVLLLGDADLIPTFYRTVHPEAGSFYPANFHIGTDLYYAIMNGPEATPPFYNEYWTPDIFLGRIPANNLMEANAIIDKIIQYEDNQWISGENRALVSGYFQDDDLTAFGGPPADGFEDRRFILTSEEIRDFLVGEGFDIDRLYTTLAAVTPTNYNAGSYDAGLPLPADLLRPTYPWNTNAAGITNAINDGRFFVFHRDHGGSRNRPSSGVEGWGDPTYEDTDVPSLSNNNHYNAVFTINCETGWFDGETDEYPNQNFESLSEAFLNRTGGGAVGVVGATRISYSGYNDNMAKGFVDAIWPNFDPNRGPANSQVKMGEVLNYGKSYMYNLEGASDTTRVEYEIFHYFGDPTMAFKIPRNLSSISGMKFNDLNGNGIKDANENPLADWSINIKGTDNITGVPVDMTKQTDANGNYVFTNLTAGTYVISETLQNGWKQTAPSTGTHTVTLTSGVTLTGLDFGNMPVPPRVPVPATSTTGVVILSGMLMVTTILVLRRTAKFERK